MESKEELKFGLIGCGELGRVHAGHVHSIPGASFSAYCDSNIGAAKRCFEEFGGEYATADVRRIMDDPKIDAVYICTRHDSHGPLAIAAAKAGKNIFIEKPLALTIAECEDIASAVEAANVHLMPAFKMRFYPLVRMAKEFIPDPQIVVAQMMSERWPDDYWAQDPVQGGGNLLSQGCHVTDIMCYLADSDPMEIMAMGGAIAHPGHLCMDTCAATIGFANGVVGSWVQSDVAVSPFTGKLFFGVFGHGRSVQLHDRLKKATFHDGKSSWQEERPEEEGFYLENVEFVSALLEQRAPCLTVGDGIRAMRMVLDTEAAIRARL